MPTPPLAAGPASPAPDNPRVVAVSGAARNLRGYIPSELGSLTFLCRLNLHDNNLYGPVPNQLFNATSLHSLFLYSNNLTGGIPLTLCSLPRLQNLDLSNNSLSGDLPSDLSRCNELQRLILSTNRFSGYIAGGIWRGLSNLVQLDHLSSNRLAGPISKEIGELKSLSSTLNLSNNYLSGEIPASLVNLPVTVSLDLRSNNLSGEIPQTGSFSNQGPTAFLNNPLLYRFLHQKPCGSASSATARDSLQETVNMSSSSRPSTERGLSQGLIVLISVADAAAVALIGLVIVYVHRKRKDNGGGGGCSCTGKAKLGGRSHGNGCNVLFPCAARAGSRYESEDGDRKSGRGGVSSGGVGEGRDLVAMDKGFEFELDELLMASAYVFGKSGLRIVYKVVLGKGVPVVVRTGRAEVQGVHRGVAFADAAINLKPS